MNKRKILALLLVVAMACSLFVSPALAAEDAGEPVATSQAASPKFNDLEGHWAESAIMRWAKEGIVQGDGDGSVNPERGLRRAELATILVRLLGLKETAPADTFSDVAAGAWYADAVLKCAKAGIMLGVGGGKAAPEAFIDRQQAIVMIGRALGVKPAAGHSLERFDDKDDVAEWAAPYMIALTDLDILSGIPQGDGVVVAPETNINRASTFALLDKAIGQYVTASGTVNATDAKKFVVVNVDDADGAVTVTGTAAGVVVATGTTADVVADKLTTDTLKVDAPVDVTISKGSAVENLDANAAAKVQNNGSVQNLNTNADGVVMDGNKPAKVNTAEDVKPATDSKGQVVTAQTTSSGSGSSSSGGSTTPKKADVVAAPLHDTRTGEGKFVADDDLYTSYSVSGTVASGENAYNVTITAKHLMKHQNDDSPASLGYWVGFGVPYEDGNTVWVGDSQVNSATGRTTEVNGKTYNTIYLEPEDDGTVFIIKNSESAVVGTYTVTVNVETAPDYENLTIAVIDSKEDYNNAMSATYLEAHPWGEGSGVAEDVWSDGETTAEEDAQIATGIGLPWLAVKYTSNIVEADGAASHVALTKDNVAVKWAHETSENYIEYPSKIGARGFTVHLKDMTGTAHDTANKTFAKQSDPYGTYVATVGDATSEPMEYLDAAATYHTVTFKANNETVQTLKIKEGESVTVPAAPETTDEVYYSGKWVNGESKVEGGTSIVVNDDLTITAEGVAFTKATAEIRGKGPAFEGEDAVAEYDYAAAYEAAGLGWANGNMTVDQKKTASFFMLAEQANELDASEEAAKAAEQREAISWTTGNYKNDGKSKVALQIGLAVKNTTPEAVKVHIKSNNAERDVILPDSQEGGSDALKGDYVQYFPAVCADGTLFHGTSDTDSADSAKWTLRMVWMKADGTPLKAEVLTVGRVNTPYSFTFAFAAKKGEEAAVELASDTVTWDQFRGADESGKEVIEAIETKFVEKLASDYVGCEPDGENGTDAFNEDMTKFTVTVPLKTIEYTVSDGTLPDETWTVDGQKDKVGEDGQPITAYGRLFAEEKPGYAFDGWYYETDDGQELLTKQSEGYTVKAEDLPKYAVLANDQWTVTFTPVYTSAVKLEAMSQAIAEIGYPETEGGAWEKFPSTEGKHDPSLFGTVSFTEGANNVWKATGEVKYIKGFTGFYPGETETAKEQQEGYYLLFMLETPAKADIAQGTIGKSNKGGFTNAVLDTVGEGDDAKTYFSCILWLGQDAPSNTQSTFTFNWSGLTINDEEVTPVKENMKSITVSIDLSGLTYGAKPTTPDPAPEA